MHKVLKLSCNYFNALTDVNCTKNVRTQRSSSLQQVTRRQIIFNHIRVIKLRSVLYFQYFSLLQYIFLQLPYYQNHIKVFTSFTLIYNKILNSRKACVYIFNYLFKPRPSPNGGWPTARHTTTNHTLTPLIPSTPSS